MNINNYTKSDFARLRKHPKQSGFSLIEIMVAALVLSIGVLRVVGLQLIGLKGTQHSSMKQQAMSVVQNLTERMRSNYEGVLSGNYVIDSESFDCGAGALPNCSTSNCNSEQLATADLHNLVCGYRSGAGSRTGGIRTLSADDIATFIDGKLNVSCADAADCSTGNMTIEVNWTERDLKREPNPSDPIVEDSLIVNTRIAQ